MVFLHPFVALLQWCALHLVTCILKMCFIELYSDKDELQVKEETGATIRCFPFEQPQGTKSCLMTGNPAAEVAIFAKSY